MDTGFPGGLDGKESACNAGNPRFNPWVWRTPWRRKRLHGVAKSQTRLSDLHFHPLQCSCLENSMDRRACQATFYGVAKRDDWATNTQRYPEKEPDSFIISLVTITKSMTDLKHNKIMLLSVQQSFRVYICVSCNSKQPTF